MLCVGFLMCVTTESGTKKWEDSWVLTLNSGHCQPLAHHVQLKMPGEMQENIYFIFLDALTSLAFKLHKITKQGRWWMNIIWASFSISTSMQCGEEANQKDKQNPNGGRVDDWGQTQFQPLQRKDCCCLLQFSFEPDSLTRQYLSSHHPCCKRLTL